MNPKHDEHDDAVQFDAFLNGDGALATALRQLPQPSPSAELDQAILADAERALAQPPAANAPDGGNPGQPSWMPHFLRRNRVPLGVAASVIFAVTIGLQWQEPRMDEAREAVIDVRLPAEAPQPPSSVMAGMDQQQAPAAPVAPAKRALRAPGKQDTVASQAQPSVSAPVAIETIQMPERIEAPKERAATHVTITGSAIARPPAAPAPPPQGKLPELRSSAAAAPPPQGKLLELRSNASAAAAPAPAAAPAAAPMLDAMPATGAQEDAKANAWLSVIEEMIKAGLARDALLEWEKFRAAYPDYPVPAELRSKISTLKP